LFLIGISFVGGLKVKSSVIIDTKNSFQIKLPENIFFQQPTNKSTKIVA